MKKFYDIWKNKFQIYDALLGTSEEQSTCHDNEHFYYLGTVYAESPKKAIDLFYENYIGDIVLSKEGLSIDDCNVIAWAKLLRKYYPLCPLNKALAISKKLFFLTENTNDLSIKIEKRDIISEQDEIEWFTEEYQIRQETDVENKEFPLYQLIISEPWSFTTYMFGEDIANDNFDEAISNLTYKILEFVPDENKQTVISIIDQIVIETENRKYTI